MVLRINKSCILFGVVHCFIQNYWTKIVIVWYYARISFVCALWVYADLWWITLLWDFVVRFVLYFIISYAWSFSSFFILYSGTWVVIDFYFYDRNWLLFKVPYGLKRWMYTSELGIARLSLVPDSAPWVCSDCWFREYRHVAATYVPLPWLRSV